MQSSNNREEYDICIIGAGVAGGLIAHQLGQAGMKVAILEAGPRHPFSERYTAMQRFLAHDNPWRSNLPERDVFTNGGNVAYPLNRYRVKGVGGSTLHWQGYTNRLHQSDFKMYSQYGIATDWPISYEDLEPYYALAEQELGVAGTDDNPFAPHRSTAYPLPAFPIGYDERKLAKVFEKLGIHPHTVPQARTSESYRGRPACVTFGVCSACPIRARYSGDIHVELAEATGNVTLIADANVVRLETDNSGRARRAVYATHDKVEHACTARGFVLAAHGVESPRLLLLSQSSAFPEGLANSSGLVGKYFMDHTGRSEVGQVDYPLYPFRKGFYTLSTEQFYDKPNRAEEAAFLIGGRAGWETAPTLAENYIRYRSGKWGEALLEELEGRLPDEYGRDFFIASMVEPLPVESNRVELDSEVKDYFGNPCPKIVYDITDYEKNTFRRTDKLTQDMFDALGAKNLNKSRLGYGGHHSGTCRMGRDPRTSVTDANLRAHDVENLHIVGSSVFVTIGAANPTLTIAALALRLANHLKTL